MIWPSFYWNPHSACRLFKCQQLMGEWISDANSRMLISFARMNILFRHQGGAFPCITVEKHCRNTFGILTNVFLFRPTAQCVGGKRWSADLFFRKNLPPSGWDPICVGGKRWSGPCQGLHWSLFPIFKWNRSLASDNIVMNYRCAVCAQNLHICACRYVRSKCKIYWNTL